MSMSRKEKLQAGHTGTWAAVILCSSSRMDTAVYMTVPGGRHTHQLLNEVNSGSEESNLNAP